MKKLLFSLVLVVFAAGAVSAGPNAYIGLYTDDAHTICRQDIPAAYMPFVTWIWILPNDLGMICAEFKLVAPAWLLSTGTTPNPGNSVILGDPYAETGVSFCFSDCQHDWVWLFQINQLPMSGGIADYINIVERPDAGAYQIANCEPGYPLDELIILNQLSLNQECVFAAENKTWGAIKSMYYE